VVAVLLHSGLVVVRSFLENSSSSDRIVLVGWVEVGEYGMCVICIDSGLIISYVGKCTLDALELVGSMRCKGSPDGRRREEDRAP
jgi:hypothetical protein